MVTILQKTNNLFSFYSWSVKAQETIASNMKWLSDDAKQHIKAGKDVPEQDWSHTWENLDSGFDSYSGMMG